MFVFSIHILCLVKKVKESLLNCFKIMNKCQFEFIVSVSRIVTDYSQFSKDIADFIGCQFALESSFGESPLANANYNFCGMKNPLVRISTAIHAGDSNYRWARYCSLHMCVVDYLLCLQYYKPISTNYDTIKNFSFFIKKFYCPSPGYIDKINLLYQQFKSFKS